MVQHLCCVHQDKNNISVTCDEILPGVLALRGALDHGKFLGHVESQVVFLGRATAKGVFPKSEKTLKSRFSMN
jgi:hypothetical protein